MHFRVGSGRQIVVPLDKIAPIKDWRGFSEQKKNKNVFKALLLEVEQPRFELELREPVITSNFLGKPQSITKIFATVDDKSAFHQALAQRLAQ